MNEPRGDPGHLPKADFSKVARKEKRPSQTERLRSTVQIVLASDSHVVLALRASKGEAWD